MQTNEIKMFAKGLVGTARTILTLNSGSEDSQFTKAIKGLVSNGLTEALMQGIREGIYALFSW